MKLLRLLFTPLLLLALGVVPFSGCSVFSPVGGAIARGYDNTVAYFNSFYNAKRLFDEAEEEIRVNERTTRTKSGLSSEPIPAPPSAKQKLALVIDKCSNILSFHPSSALVDDALLLIGKSYFYQGDFLKAERKFAELMSGFPESSIVLEGELWFLKTLARSKKYDEAAEAASVLLLNAGNEGEDEIVAETYAVQGDIFGAQDDRPKALEAYHRALSLSSEDDLKSVVQFRIANELFLAKEFDKAASTFLGVEEYTDETGILISSRLHTIRALRSAGRFEKALEICDKTHGDFRFAQHEKEVILERGLTYAGQNSFDRALAELLSVDTTSARTELGSKAAFEVARLYEFQFGDYRSAQDAYARATAYPLPAIFNDARRRQLAFSRYFTLLAERKLRDSVFALFQTPPPDVLTDSTFTLPSAQTLDSLQSAQAVSAYDLGEVFYAELENPDSAVFWFRHALRSLRDSTRSARILFILAELSTSHPEKQFGVAADLYRRIITDHPTSVYASRSKVQLGIPVEPAAIDSGQIMYRKAEASIEAGRFQEAIPLLRAIVRNYPLSSYAPKSEYAMGYVYEYHLAKPDSALKHYRNLVEMYGTTSYAAAVRQKIRLNTEEAQKDTVTPPLLEKVRDEAPVSGQPTDPGLPALPPKELRQSRDEGPGSKRSAESSAPAPRPVTPAQKKEDE